MDQRYVGIDLHRRRSVVVHKDRDGNVLRVVQFENSAKAFSPDPLVCPCSTMFRIDEPHLAWILEGLVEGDVRNRIAVPEDVAEDARIALERMLQIT